MVEPQTYRALRLNKYNEPLTIETYSIPKPSKNQILVRVHYVPINPTDLLYLSGWNRWNPYPATPGSEGSGTVVEVGPELNVEHKVGDRVGFFGFGSWGEYALVESEKAAPIHADTSFQEAASSYINPATVSLFVTEEVLKGGHKAVVHSAGASALGKQLIRELKAHGIKSINLVRKDEYIQGLKDIGADYVLNIKSADFEANLKKVAAEEQATIALDAVGGELSGKILSALPPKSHYLLYGVLDSPDLKISAASLFEGKVVRVFSFGAAFGSKTIKERQELGLEIQKKLKTVFKTEISKVYGFEESKAAIDHYNANASKGKVLLKFE